MACGVNVLIVQLLEHAILYPDCINTKTSAASCMRWVQKYLYCVAMRSYTHRCCFVQGSNKVKGSFFPLRHFQAAGADTRGDTMGSRHLEL